MAILLEVYNDMIKEAEETAAKAVVQERVAMLDKYATLATELLNAEFPNDFDKNDVVELADKLIERDVAIADMQEKTAEAKELLGEYVKVSQSLMEQQYGKDFTPADVEKLASTLYEMDATAELEKEADVIAMSAFLDEFNKLAETDFQTPEELEEAIKQAGVTGADKIWKGVKGAMTGIGKKVSKGVKTVAQSAVKHPYAAAGVAAGVPAASFAAGRFMGGDEK
jgi:patatin-like phospholipase/acyl hydrolase